MNTNRIIFPIALSVLFSCQKQDLPSGNELWFSAIIDNANSTKGAEVTTSTLNIDNNIFTLDAWLESANRGNAEPKFDTDPHYLTAKDMKHSGSVWKGTDCYWINQVRTNFWAVYPKAAVSLTWPATPSTITDAQEKTPSFTYDMTKYSGTNKDAAEKTQDILVAYARGYRNEDEQTGGVIKLKFKHAMSELRFKKGHIDDGFNITEIKVGGIYLKGTCNLTGSTVGVKDSLKIEWTGTGTPSKEVGLAQTVTLSGVADGGYITGTNMLFVIPQAMSDKTTLSAVISGVFEGSTTSTQTKEVALSSYSWKPGKKYEYSLSFYKEKNELTVSVNEYNVVSGSWTD